MISSGVVVVRIVVVVKIVVDISTAAVVVGKVVVGVVVGAADAADFVVVSGSVEGPCSVFGRKITHGKTMATSRIIPKPMPPPIFS